jgi:alpha-ketoglutarate-dependent taurine dioxygenase
MSQFKVQKPNMKALGSTVRKSIDLSPAQLVTTGPLKPGQALPLVIRPEVDGIDLPIWAGENRQEIDSLLLEHRALLFRGFDIRGAAEFKNFVMSTSDGNLMEYTDRSTPRLTVGDGVYVSTIYPADQRIDLHNEGTYWTSWPMKLYFCCQKTADQGGETPIADVRAVLARIDPAIRQRFREKQVMYVRNYNDGFGLTWQEVFQTNNSSEVESYCRKNAIEFEWKDGARLRTRQVRPAIRKHPRSHEEVWFNHAAFFHISARDEVVAKGLLGMFDEQDLPYMTYYEDGSSIDESDIRHIREAYDREKIIFAWEDGDILLLDNMSVAHGRQPYCGERQIVVAMAEPHTENNLTQ